MERFFLLIFSYFRSRKIFFFPIVIVVGLVSSFLASRITLEEDISKSLKVDNDNISKILKQSRFTNKIILNIYSSDSTAVEPEKLIEFADEVVDSLQSKNFARFIAKTTFRINDDFIQEIMNTFTLNLPIFLDEKDFEKMDSLLLPETIEKSLKNNYNSLISPSSFVMKNFILEDPVGIKSLALNKLKQFQIEDSYEIIDGYIFTRDRRNLLLFINPVNSSNETFKNGVFLKNLDKLFNYLSVKNTLKIKTEYYGSAAVAVGNADQIKRDIALTVSVAMLIILVFIGWYFRSIIIPFISFLPAVFGGISALAILLILNGKMSTIALGIGSVLLGIIVDYSLYIFSLHKTKGSMKSVIKDMSSPIILCSLTTSIAFFSLLFVKSEVLRDLGLFAGLSIIGAALFSLIVLPHLIKTENKPSKLRKATFIDKIVAYKLESNRYVLLSILIITIVFLFYSKKATFETDMYSMNYLSSKMKQAEKNLNRINGGSLNSIYVFSIGQDLTKALSINANISKKLERLKDENIVKKYTNVGTVLINDSIQKVRIQKWNDYWSPEKKEKIKNLLIKTGERYRFKKDAFYKFYNFLDYNFQPVEISKFNDIRDLFINDMITENKEFTMIMSVVKVNSEDRTKLYSAFKGEKNSIVIDWQELTSSFVNNTKLDFDLIVKLCMIFVTLVLILSFGRIETGIIAALPMFVSWLWTLGFMGVLGIKFNIFNIIVSTFVFGLGVDYAILMMRGLLLENMYGQIEMGSYKTSIFLSSFTTLVGTGVLMLAKHPSLYSIGLVSILGLISVVLISYTLEPVLFNWLVAKKGRKRFLPVTMTDILTTIFAFSIGLVFCILLNLLFLLVLLLPVPSKVKRGILHQAIFISLRMTSLGMISVKKTTINNSNEDLKKPSVIIANHQSHIDLPLLLMQSPKIIVLTNRWVWNNPLYALIIRYLGFYSVTNGFEPLIAKLRKKIEEGYSILVFPEGTRSPDSTIKRFHKGAFLLAEELNLDIIPVLIHGAGDCMNKGENHIRRGSVTIKILPRIKAGDKSFGNDYHERTKSILKFFRNEYLNLRFELETPSYFRTKLIRNYIYKGPILEWYVRIKLSLERNYEIIHNKIPSDANIVDIGCGYGMLSYMLNFTSEKRNILGIDYDKDKIELASHCVSKNDRINFVNSDAMTYNYPQSDVFILSDVLHYMTESDQEHLLHNCIENLNPGGVIIIRDGDKDMQKRHLGTRYTEFFSTRFGFNKTIYKKLFFLSSKQINQVAVKNRMSVEIIDNSKFTSNLLYLLRFDSVEEVNVKI